MLPHDIMNVIKFRYKTQYLTSVLGDEWINFLITHSSDDDAVGREILKILKEIKTEYSRIFVLVMEPKLIHFVNDVWEDIQPVIWNIKEYLKDFAPETLPDYIPKLFNIQDILCTDSEQHDVILKTSSSIEQVYIITSTTTIQWLTYHIMETLSDDAIEATNYRMIFTMDDNIEKTNYYNSSIIGEYLIMIWFYMRFLSWGDAKYTKDVMKQWFRNFFTNDLHLSAFSGKRKEFNIDPKILASIIYDNEEDRINFLLKL